jgi:thiamine-phosphate pyrophosphorylase
LTEAVKQAILGGCTMVQLREKSSSSRDFFQQAQEVKRITNQYQVPLIINDRLDIALAVGAFGIHIGQNDLPVPVVRQIVGKDMLLGVSVSSAEEAGQAMEDGADYLGVGAMFPTGTKTDAGMVSMEELIRIRCITNLPIVVIGGINRENAGVFRPMGIDGLAVVSSIIGQPDIRKAAEEMKKAFYGEADDGVGSGNI